MALSRHFDGTRLAPVTHFAPQHTAALFNHVADPRDHGGRRSRQILLRDGATETIVVFDEGRDEFMQAGLEDVVHAGVL
jgi:hypothetical protein